MHQRFAAGPDKAAASDAIAGVWAERRFTWPQAFLLLLLGVAAIGVWVTTPAAAAAGATVLCSLLYAGHMTYRAVIWTAGCIPSPSAQPTRTDDELPVYSVIVPMYDEANVVPATLVALGALDYPRDRLDVLFALEPDDRRTRAALDAQNLPDWCRIVVAPVGAPRTKPRAANAALKLARGLFVVVYDAEDRPEPAQLREAVAAFDAGGPRLACVQARLAPDNRRANLLTRLFALDFCQWFDAMLVGLQRLGQPVPLGGTSNHFRTAVLREAGGWDAYNVTEDADVGIRLWRLGWKTAILASTTWEEAPVAGYVWHRQRTRWIRGYIQTFFVHARSGRTLGLPPLGFGGWLFLILFVGASWLFALLHPIFWGMMAYGVAGGTDLSWLFDGPAGQVTLVSIIVGNFFAFLIAALGPLRRRWWTLIPWALFIPLYWVLISVAAYNAMITFAFDPYRWEKTPHGLSDRGEPG